MEEVHRYMAQIIMNCLVGVVAIDLIVPKDRHRNALDSGVAHALKQIPVMLSDAPMKQRQ
jgi:hypothetical protein